MADLQTLLNKFLQDLYSGTVGATAGVKFAIQNGSASAPSLTDSTATSGLYVKAAGAWAYATGSNPTVQFDTGGLKANSLILDVTNQDAGISRIGAASLGVGTGSGGDFSGALKLTTLTINSGTAFTTSTALTNNAAAQTATLTNSPTAGNPTKWFPINDNGTTRNIPAW